jgi:hypothetical protein
MAVKQWWTGRAKCQRKEKEAKENKVTIYLIWIHKQKQRNLRFREKNGEVGKYIGVWIISVLNLMPDELPLDCKILK